MCHRSLTELIENGCFELINNWRKKSSSSEYSQKNLHHLHLNVIKDWEQNAEFIKIWFQVNGHGYYCDDTKWIAENIV